MSFCSQKRAVIEPALFGSPRSGRTCDLGWNPSPGSTGHRSNEHGGGILGRADRAVLKRTAERRGQRFRRCPTPYRLFRFNAMNFSAQLSSRLRLRWQYKSGDFACAELPRLVPDLNTMHTCLLPRCQLVASLRFRPAGGADNFMAPKIVPRVAR